MTKVYVICTGGTISMLDENDNAADKNAAFQDRVNKILPFKINAPEITFKVYSPLIDSSEMTIDRWNEIGAEIESKYHEYDGFVILHGTDTMAYTGSALSFMFSNLHKPVILTGAQTPLSEEINDARENLINAIHIAAHFPINEVCIYFNRSIFRANRVTKYSTYDYDAYISPNYPILGSVNSSIEVKKELLLATPDTGELMFTPLAHADIRFVHLMPHMQPAEFERMIQGAKAVIIGSYGDGNIRIRTNGFIDVIDSHRKKGVIFVNKSQCLRSKTTPQYDAGELLDKIGLICAGDQTLEALTCKLLYIFSKEMTHTAILRAMKTNMRGELTPQTRPVHHFKLFDGTALPPKTIPIDARRSNCIVPVPTAPAFGPVVTATKG